MCIYLGYDDKLTYTKQEHIFPAGIGGMQKLSRGVVSDQANELFSPLELKLMHNSLISLDRAYKGPGKRGSLSPNKSTQSIITVGQQDNGDIMFSYLSNGISHIISCFMRSGCKINITLSKEHESPMISRRALVDNMKEYKGQYIVCQSDYVPEGCLLIGYHNKNYYVGSNTQEVSSTTVEKEVSDFLRSYNYTPTESKYSNNLVLDYPFLEGRDIARVYAKIAFNILAYIKGEEYVAHPRFDEIREKILGVGSKELEYFPTEYDDGTRSIFPEDAHSCVITGIDNNVFANVRLYGHWGCMIALGYDLMNDFTVPDGFICDWKNRKEYRIIDYLLNRKNDGFV